MLQYSAPIGLLLAMAITNLSMAQDSLSGPRIHFGSLIHDYDTIPFGSDGRCSFTFKNTGDAPLVISTFRSSCGCLVPDWDREPVMPGTSGTVRLKYDTLREGPFTKSATLHSNAVDAPVLVLRIKGYVSPRNDPEGPKARW